MGSDVAPDGVAGHGRPVNAILRWVGFGEQFVGVLALATIFALVLTQAIQRYLPMGGWAWTGELAQYCLVWLTFGLVGYLMGRDEHITLKLADNMRSPALRRGVHVFAHLVVAVICVGFVGEGFNLVSSDSGQVSPALQMPLVAVYVVPLLGFALTGLRAVLAMFRSPSGGTDTSADPHPGGSAE